MWTAACFLVVLLDGVGLIGGARLADPPQRHTKAAMRNYALHTYDACLGGTAQSYRLQTYRTHASIFILCMSYGPLFTIAGTTRCTTRMASAGRTTWFAGEAPSLSLLLVLGCL